MSLPVSHDWQMLEWMNQYYSYYYMQPNYQNVKLSPNIMKQIDAPDLHLHPTTLSCSHHTEFLQWPISARVEVAACCHFSSDSLPFMNIFSSGSWEHNTNQLFCRLAVHTGQFGTPINILCGCEQMLDNQFCKRAHHSQIWSTQVLSTFLCW